MSIFYRYGYEEFNDTFMYSDTMRGQEEEEKKMKLKNNNKFFIQI
ncbi:hypothetical protein QNH48_17820 [Neobacillus sp. YX16]|nr:hypothetical protein [Neobacillus sp. YX16]WHZ00897.1 hypothetical protein QNH48_17820 [Neobacillus sp. YX16]